MIRYAFIFILILTLSVLVFAQVPEHRPHPPGNRLAAIPMNPPVVIPNQPGYPPTQKITLWPPDAKIQQILEIAETDLRQITRGRRELSGVQLMVIADYTIPGPVVPPMKVLEFYKSRFFPPNWQPFYQNERNDANTAAIAFKGSNGFISVLARPRGATVTYIQGNIQLGAIPLLEQVIKETIANIDNDPIEVQMAADAAVRLKNAGKVDEAVRELKKILERYPNSLSAHYNLARIFVDQKKFDDAKQHYRAAIASAPQNTAFRIEYTQFLIERGDLESAQYELEQAIKINPWSVPLHISLGQVLEARSLPKQAETVYRRIIEIDPRSPGAYTDLGRVLEKQERKSEALRVYQDALKLDPNDSTASEAIERLSK